MKTSLAPALDELTELSDFRTVHLTEDSVAIQFTDCYKHLLRWCNHTGKWYAWDGTIWRKNEKGLAFHWARELVRDMSKKASTKTRFITSKTGFAAGVERFC